MDNDEPVAVRYSFDGHGYQYLDSSSGSDWMTRIPDGELLYTRSEVKEDRPWYPDDNPNWREHTPGDNIPCGKQVRVAILLRKERDDRVYTKGDYYRAEHFVWGPFPQAPQYDIVAWRPVDEYE